MSKRKVVRPPHRRGHGKPDAVLQLLREAIEHNGAHRPLAAAAVYERVLAKDPDNTLALNNLGATLRGLGQRAEAMGHLRRAIDLKPDFANACANLGLCLADDGDHDAALASFDRALAIDPGHASALTARGTILNALGRYAEAQACHDKALAAEPGNVAALNNLGNTLRAQGRPKEAIECYRRAIKQDPGPASCHLNLGLCLADTGNVAKAIDSFRRALARDPTLAVGYSNLGKNLSLIFQHAAAAEAHRHAIALEPGNPDHYVNLGAALKGRGRQSVAAAAFRQALQIDPACAPAYNNLANLLREHGQLDDAVALLRQALAITPDYPHAFSNYLFCLNSLGDVAPEDCLREHRRFGAMYEAPPPVFAQSRDPERRLRIGYSSPDLRAHSVAYFLEDILESHDRRRFHITCYADNHAVDSVTRRLQSKVDVWRETSAADDSRFHEMVRADGIDILVDLAGHTAHNRLQAFARRAAPVQVTWIGYPNTTGLASMDYRLTDAWADPPGVTDGFHSERLVRLPRGFLCFRPSHQAPAVVPRPMLAGTGVTFGSFNALSKTTPAVIALWARVLRAVPGSRLLLKNNAFNDADTVRRFQERFAAHGIASDRLIPLAHIDSPTGHLSAYGRIDIALDPFPYNGTTTTCEALWMGVPVITLEGDRHVARVGVSLLKRLDLDELITTTADDYVARAMELAGDPERLDRLSRGMRARITASSLCDKVGFTGDVETAYRQMWRSWCAEAPAAPPEAGSSPAEPATTPPPPDTRLEAAFAQAVALVRQGDLKAAEAAFRAILAVRADWPEALHNLATVIKLQGRLPEAERLLRQAITAKPDYAGACATLGATLLELGRAAEAEDICRRGVALDPGHRNAVANLGLVLQARHQPDAAIEALRTALRIGPPTAVIHSNLATVLAGQGRLSEAIAACREAIRLDGAFAEALANLASILTSQGRLREAIDTHRQVVALRPTLTHAVSNLLFALNYDDDLSPRAVFDEHRRWGARLGAVPAIRSHANGVDAKRRLKIGYLSPDLNGHSVIFFLLPLLAAHDRGEVEIFCYANVAVPDYFSQQAHAATDHWRRIIGLPDDDVVRLIQRDGIDILVDLAGHTSKNRLGVFARKPAPVQVTWLGYPNTTGIAAIDYRITDAVADPEGEADTLNTERLVRLPRGFLCYRPGPKPMEVAPPPSAAHGPITFGSFNNLSKVTPRTVALWARVLRRVPNSRLLFKAKPLEDAETRRRYAELFAAHDIGPERIDTLGWIPYLKDHLHLYNQVDIALDTVPYNGTTTTCEALWMGVPVVTLAGDRHAGRVGASLLTQVGLEELVADGDDDFVETAAALASDPARLSQLRAGLRPRLESSPLRDEAGFARAMETAYRAMWARWCAAHAGPAGGDGAEANAARTLVAEAIRHHQAGRLAAAAQLYKRVLERDPDQVEALNLLGVILAQSGATEQAIALIGRAVARRPDHAGALNNLGGALREAGRLGEAAECFRRALALKPDYADARKNLDLTEPGLRSSS